MTLTVKSYKTKGKTNFNKIEINNDTMRPVRRGVMLPCEKHIYAFDFEVLTHTRKGTRKTLPVMLGIAGVDGKTGNLIESKVFDILNGKKWIDLEFSERRELLLEVLRILTRRKYADECSQKFFYNIRYDFGVIASLMTEEEIVHLYHLERVEIDDYIIEVIGNKMFTIRKKSDKKKRRWTYYDLMAFTMQGLDKATKDWLGEKGGKLEGFDTAEIFNDENLLRKDYARAVEYCKRDVEIAAMLGFEVRKEFERMDIPFSRPISPASLFKAYMAYHKKPFPAFDTEDLYEKKLEELKEKNIKRYNFLVRKKETGKRLQELCWEGYFGGHFEMFKRGYFEDVTGFDYNSMYPSIMVKLPDLSYCRVEELLPDICCQETMTEEIKQSDWAVIKAKVWTKPGKIQIFPVRVTIKTEHGTYEKVIRPVMNGQEVIMCKQMFEFFTEEYPHFKDIEITGGFVVKEKPDCKRPFEWMKDLYKVRVEIIKKHGKGDKRQLVIKIILNAGYGVTAETILVEVWTIEDGILEFDRTFVKPGKFFRPFYAFHITELARLQIYKDIFECGIEDDVIGVATDCIFVEGRGKEKLLDYENYVPNEKVLGKLSLDKEGEMLVIGNGIYLIRDKEGNVHKTTRGFDKVAFPNLFEECQDTDKIVVYKTRPYTWKEIALKIQRGEGSPDEIGVFIEDVKTCNINMDCSRIWEGSFASVAEMFTKTLDSRPIVLEEV